MAGCHTLLCSLILYHLQHVGNLLDALLQRFLHHLLDEHVELSLDGELHLRRGGGDGQQLDPEVEWYGALLALELDALRLIAVYDAQAD